MSTARARWARASLAGLLSAALTAAASAQNVPDSLKGGFSALKGRVRAQPLQALCAGEVLEPGVRGAWYRKVVSLPDPRSVAVRGRVTLPQVRADPARQMPRRDGDPFWWEGPLDHPSVYLGVSARPLEVDAGLSWEREVDDAGLPALAADGGPLFAFHPFWRVTQGGLSVFGPPPGDPKPSFSPGERVTMSLEVVSDGQLVLSLSGAGGETWSSVFAAPGLRRDAAGRPRSFKRVDAIDQYRWDGKTHRGNENSDALPTRAAALGARWASSEVRARDGTWRPLAGKDCRVAVGAQREASSPPAVRASQPTPLGGELVDLSPSR